MNVSDRLTLDQATQLVDELLGGPERRVLLEFFTASCLYASRQDDVNALVAAAFPREGPPYEYIRLWLGPVNLIRTYKNGVYAALDTRVLPDSLVEHLDRHNHI